MRLAILKSVERQDLWETEISPGNPELIEIIKREILTSGEITFARFMELALYNPEHGYYLTAHRRPGRDGDFLTAPEASAYFGLTFARQIAECWERLDWPENFEIREYGSGVGGLAYDIMAELSEAAPDAFARLRYRMVEPNPHRLSQALSAMGEVGLGDRVIGERFDPDSPLDPITGVVIANEVADALPVHRLKCRNGVLHECYVTWSGEAFVEVEGALSPATRRGAAYFARHQITLTKGHVTMSVLPPRPGLHGALRGLERGYSITIDYGYPVTSLYQSHRLQGTVRGYFEHTVTDDPLVRVGDQDLTAHVDFTALQEAGEADGLVLAGFTTQGAMLASLGLGDRLLSLQQDRTATIADYASAQAVVMRLIDPGGLGRFGVLLMAKSAPVDPPLLSLASPPPGF